MKAVLDHVGIAVRDLAAALAFYRDALGLDVEAPREVASQQVRTHFVPLGDANLELIEATARGSPVARFLEKHGPGLHHITLRVVDIHAALAELRARGARLIDDHPRRGADGALIAFVHPSSAHGVLVELKQGAGGQAAVESRQSSVDSRRSTADRRESAVTRYTLGDLELISVCDGFFRLDGGAMFGTVPKRLWEKRVPVDRQNRITLAMRPLVVRGERTVIIDAGLGDKENEKFVELYGVERERNLDHTLAEAGLTSEDIDIVIASHLHFDHAGGFTARDSAGRLRPRFPRARYIVRRGEWEDATHPHERNRASYLVDNYVPLADAGVLQLVDQDQTIMPGVRLRRTGGHTMHHQIVVIESGGQTAAFVADLMPTAAHVAEPWIMGYDLYPMDTLAAKKAFLSDAVMARSLVFFEHDPVVAAGNVVEENGRRRVLPAVT